MIPPITIPAMAPGDIVALDIPLVLSKLLPSELADRAEVLVVDDSDAAVAGPPELAPDSRLVDGAEVVTEPVGGAGVVYGVEGDSFVH